MRFRVHHITVAHVVILGKFPAGVFNNWSDICARVTKGGCVAADTNQNVHLVYNTRQFDYGLLSFTMV